VAYVPQRLVVLLHHVHDSETIFLIGSIVLLIVGGSVLEGLPALNILGPLLLPIAGKIGLSELHYGIVLIIARASAPSFRRPASASMSAAPSHGRRSSKPRARWCPISWY
jgi:TRAP-type mannitol/chloroaromatic compound transport system permease large subunit